MRKKQSEPAFAYGRAGENWCQTHGGWPLRSNLYALWAGDAEAAAKAIERIVRQFVRGIEKACHDAGVNFLQERTKTYGHEAIDGQPNCAA